MPLRRIVLRDFVIVRELDLYLASGFCVLTGETGAGKSILIDALQLALGARADAGVVREGAPRADISVEFEAIAGLQPWLDAAGIEGTDALLLRRTIDAQGKSRFWINGTTATAAQLRELAERLVDIHGQHAWQSLTRAAAVRELLDGYADIDPSPLQTLWRTWRNAARELEEGRAAQDSLAQERERLAWQIGELAKLAPGALEWEELNANHKRLANAQTLIEAAQTALAVLEDEPTGALVYMARARSALAAQQQVEPQFAELAQILDASLAQAQDAAHSLHGYLHKTEVDPEGLAALDDRLTLWLSLARRFKRSPADLPTVMADWQAALAKLDAAGNLSALEAAQTTAHSDYLIKAQQISAQRVRAAPRLSQAVTQAMQGLGMEGGRFEVALQASAQPSTAGLEDVAFLVSAHPGATPKPVGKVASGGELSRIALAIAVTTSQLGEAQTLIFDEVDAGIGGSVAQTVGRLLKQLGRDRQVLAVTHLPQVAACADHHLVVTKLTAQHVTSSTVCAVEGEQRVAELARMLGGEQSSGASVAHAREMLDTNGQMLERA